MIKTCACCGSVGVVCRRLGGGHVLRWVSTPELADQGLLCAPTAELGKDQSRTRRGAKHARKSRRFWVTWHLHSLEQRSRKKQSKHNGWI